MSEALRGVTTCIPSHGLARQVVSLAHLILDQSQAHVVSYSL